MIISDALPVQFWVNGVDTYNQKEVCGITPVCFCQPFNCDDEIKIQFQDDAGQEYNLMVYDSNDYELTTVEFDEVIDGIYQVTFIPSELSPSICEKVMFKIFKTGDIEDYPDFVNGDISGGTIAPSTSVGSGNGWSYSTAHGGCAGASLFSALPSLTDSYRMPLT